MPKFVVEAGCSVKHGGRIYDEGETIEMDAKAVYPGLHVVPAGSPQGQVLKQAAGAEGGAGNPANDKGQAGNKPGDDKGQTGNKPGDDKGQTGNKPGDDKGTK